MREIRFRVWDKENKKMLNVAAISWSTLDVIAFNIDIEPEEDIIMDFKNCVLMQYTGLKDKNGKEIYEGDIIQGNLFDRRLPTIGKVIYSEYGVWANENLAGETFLFKIAEIEVIGNIYENPDLLKPDQEAR